MKMVKSILFAGCLGLGFLSAGCGAKIDADKVAKCVQSPPATADECKKCCTDAGASGHMFSQVADKPVCGCM